MKTRNSNEQTEIVQQDSGCCGSQASQVKENKETSCCEQPTDGSSCCDTDKSKEENSKKTGCC